MNLGENCKRVGNTSNLDYRDFTVEFIFAGVIISDIWDNSIFSIYTIHFPHLYTQAMGQSDCHPFKPE